MSKMTRDTLPVNKHVTQYTSSLPLTDKEKSAVCPQLLYRCKSSTEIFPSFANPTCTNQHDSL